MNVRSDSQALLPTLWNEWIHSECALCVTASASILPLNCYQGLNLDIHSRPGSLRKVFVFGPVFFMCPFRHCCIFCKCSLVCTLKMLNFCYVAYYDVFPSFIILSFTTTLPSKQMEIQIISTALTLSIIFNQWKEQYDWGCDSVRD